MIFTGERVVPDKMRGDTKTLTEHLARYVWALNFCSDLKVLDAACGTCYGLHIISAVASEVYGLDISEESLDYAKAHYNFYHKPCVLGVCDFEKTGFINITKFKKFDVILSFETIEHLADPYPFLKNVRSSLVVDGLFIFSIPNTNPSPFHKQIYDFDRARELIAKYFNDVSWYGQDNMYIGACTPEKTFFIGLARN